MLLVMIRLLVFENKCKFTLHSCEIHEICLCSNFRFFFFCLVVEILEEKNYFCSEIKAVFLLEALEIFIRVSLMILREDVLYEHVFPPFD